MSYVVHMGYLWVHMGCLWGSCGVSLGAYGVSVGILYCAEPKAGLHMILREAHLLQKPKKMSETDRSSLVIGETHDSS